jgi:hypothetical protein
MNIFKTAPPPGLPLPLSPVCGITDSQGMALVVYSLCGARGLHVQYDDLAPPPPLSSTSHCHSRLLGRTAARSSRCRRHRTGTRVGGLQAVHRDDLLPLAHLDGVGLRPSVATTWYGPAYGCTSGNSRWPGPWGR